MEENRWARLLAYVTGLVNQRLLLQNEYLAAENRILRSRFPARMRLSDPERSTLAEIGKRLGRAALHQGSLRRETRYDSRLVPDQVFNVVKPASAGSRYMGRRRNPL